MRRSILISTLLAASVAVLGACDPKSDVPNKPTATPTPVATASPAASPSASPAKTDDVKKDGVKTDGKNVNGNINKEVKEVKPAETPKAK
ncbi:MAG: hypothetical protein ACKVQW_08315 [Pyrinomonadaceae bacterium]